MNDPSKPLKSILRKTPQAGVKSVPTATTTASTTNGDAARSDDEASLQSKGVKFSIEAIHHSRLQPPNVDTGSDILVEMEKGNTFIKLRNKKAYERFYYYNPQASTLCWFSRKSGGGVKSIDIAALTSLTEGMGSKGFHHFETQQHSPGQCFTVEHTGGVLDLIAETRDVRDLWMAGFRFLMKQAMGGRANGVATKNRTAWINASFDEKAKGSSTLKAETATSLLAMLCPFANNNFITEKLSYIAGAQSKTLDSAEFSVDDVKAALKALSSSIPTFFLFQQYSSLSDAITADDLATFLEVEQETLKETPESCVVYIEQYEPVPENKAAKLLSYNGFFHFLKQHSLISVASVATETDMTWPLNHYFIQSSHNTYLSGNQVNEPCSAERYKDVLHQGARLIEVDIWMSPDGGEFVITHGETETAPCPLHEALDIINEHAFAYTDYPLILAVEMHLQTEEDQAALAALFSSIFGAKLVLRSSPLYTPDALPSPEDLRQKILVCSQRGDDDKPVEMVEYDEYAAYVPKKKRKTKPKVGKGKRGSKEIKKITIYPAWSKVVALHHDVVPAEIEGPLDPWTVVSLSEDHILRAYDYGITDQVLHVTRHQIVRCFPSMGKVSSANYNPALFWSTGCSCASMNFQTHDIGLHASQLRFLAAGGTGFAKKPTFLTAERSVYTPQPDLSSAMARAKTVRELLAATPRVVEVTVHSASQLTPSEKWRSERKELHQVVDPYVHVHILGVPDDDVSHTTRAIDNCLFNPYWNESAKFAVTCPPLAQLQLLILDDDLGRDNFMGQVILPLESVRPGHHHLQLYDEHVQPIPGSTIFIRVQFHPVTADQLSTVMNENKDLSAHFEEAQSARSKRASFQAEKARLQSRDMLKETGDPEYDVTIKECNDVLAAVYHLLEDVDASHQTFFQSAGVDPMTPITDAIDTVAKQLKRVRYTVADNGQGLKISVNDGHKLPSTVSNAIKALEGFSAASAKYLRKVQELAEKSTHFDKQLRQLKTTAKNGKATNSSLLFALDGNIKLFRSVPLKVTETASIVDEEVFTLKHALVRHRRSSVHASRIPERKKK